jgi:RNA polymerase sigma-70 factor (ECF subfamily)
MANPQPDTGQEVEWVKRAQRGESEAFGPLVERYQRRIFSLVYHVLQRRDEVEDITQEIFIKAFRSVRGYNFRASFGTWLSRIAMNHCYDHLRRSRASRVSYYWQLTEEGQRELEAKLESPEAQRLDEGERAALRDLVGKLLERAPRRDRVILVLKELEDYSVEEIAEILRLNASTVKVRLHRARKRMLEDIKRWGPGRVPSGTGQGPAPYGTEQGR